MVRAWALVRTIIFSALFLSLLTWFVPRWFGVPLVVVNPAAWAVIGAGLALSLWCAVEFALRGRGTPAPFDPPRRLVVQGLYRFVRNPMYLGLGVLLAGEAWLFARWEFVIEIFAVWLAVHLFVIGYEEPVLRGKFGAAYEDYCAHVGRWIPRLRPFDKADGAA